jgi:hypothetical protein
MKTTTVVDEIKQEAQAILSANPSAKIVYLSIDPEAPVRDSEGRFQTVDSVFAFDSDAEDRDPLDIMQVADLHECDGDAPEHDCIDGQLLNNSAALDSVIADAAKLGYTHYVLDNGHEEVSSGSTTADGKPDGPPAERKESVATQTFIPQEVKSEFLRLMDVTKEFYVNNPKSDVKTWIFLTGEGGIEQVESESEDGNLVYPQAECEFGSPVWLIAILGKDTDFSVAGMIQLLPDLAEACQLRDYYFMYRT